jgi:hypothetical protein
MEEGAPKRVTLSDFQRLQQALLETRQALYDSRDREAKALEQLSRAPPPTASAKAFPPPPPRRRATTSGHPTQQQGEALYPAELNPFGAVSAPQQARPCACARSKPNGCYGGSTAPAAAEQAPTPSVGRQTDGRFGTAMGAEGAGSADTMVPARRSEAREAVLHERHVRHSVAQRQRWLLRLVFHAHRTAKPASCAT